MRSCYILIACTVFILFMARCSVQKRQYRNGYFIDGLLRQKSKATLLPETGRSGKKTISLLERNTTNFEHESFSEASAPSSSFDTKPQVNSKLPDAERCDSLFLKDGSVLEVKIKEIGTKDIRYKICDFQEGPDYLVEKFRVSSIRFSNGTRELFNESTLPIQPKNRTNDSAAPKALEKNSNAAFSLSFGILGIYPLAFIGSVIGIIFGALALNDFKTHPGRYSNETMGKVGLGLSIAGIVFWALLISWLLLI